MKTIPMRCGVGLLLLPALLAGVARVNAATTNTVVFLETMAADPVVPPAAWTGAGCNNPWTVADNGFNPFQQNANANYGGGNTNGLTFKGGTTNLDDSTITTVNGINAAGNGGTVGFYLQIPSPATNSYAAWAMQVNPGTGSFTTRLSGQTTTNQGWQFYNYNLQPGDLVSNLSLRFQFSENNPGNRIFLDYISVTIQTGTNNLSGMLHLPDTGQTVSYTSTFGEDSDYTIHPPAYANNGDGTISDKVTGLMWQQTDSGALTWASATNYPSTLTLGGYSDWRLPTSQELFSLTKQNGFAPALDTNYFTVTTADSWWTQDAQVDNASNLWVVDQGGGIGPQPMNALLTAVRCVRGAPAPPANSPIHHFVNNGDGTITDSDTGLMWQQGELPSATNWEGALAYAASATLGGHADWRVPNIKEIQSINDPTLAAPSVDTNYFPGAAAAAYWSSTTVPAATNCAWCLNFQYGVATNAAKTGNLLLRCVRGGTTNFPAAFSAQFVRIPGASFVMGDHFDYVDPKHYTDEVPLHNVCISTLYMATTLCTMTEYCAYLNAALYQGLIEVRTNDVYAVGGTNIYFYTYTPSNYSLILWTNNAFVVLNSTNRLTRPVTSVRWFGAMAYCNWLSQQGGFKPGYDLDTGDVDFTKNGFRLPTEAEWEFCAHGGLTNPYCMFPWGTNSNPDGTFANWENSGDPFEVDTDYPNTTPVGFYNGALRLQSDDNWPGSQASYQTSDGSCPYGLYDMAGNVWEWCNDWYENVYYSYCTNFNIVTNPPGPAFTNTAAYGTNGTLYGCADLMPDGQPWRCLRGGTWWNGGDQTNFGYSRVSNRDPGYYLGGGPGDLDSQYSQTGFRVMRPEKLTQTVGLFLNTTSACPGYTLMSPMQGTNTYLLNNAGQYVHQWTSQYNPGRADYLMTNGHLLRACAIPKTVISTGGGEGGRLEEHDWLGNLVWVFELNTATNLTHHDFKVLPNGNVLLIASEVKTCADVIAAGFNPSLLVSAITTNGGFMLPDYLIEVQPVAKNGTTNGTIIWEWHTWDHLIQNYDSTKNNYGVVSNHVELVNANGPGIQIQQFWNHFNGIDYNPQLDQILISCRNNSEIWVIDHSTTTAQAASHAGGNHNQGGDLLYRWGNPQQYQLGGAKSEMLWQQHCATWIPTNCPDAGNILVFNNGVGRGYTSVDEIAPPVDAFGNYSSAPGSAFGPTSLYWTYTNNPATNFYCDDIGGAEREPNGDTLICYGIFGTLFEVTANGQTVWDYVNPETHAPLAQGSAIPPDPNAVGEDLNEVFKVHRYAANFAGFTGKDLTPRGTVETYTGAATDTVGLGLPDLWVRAQFGSLSAVTATSSHSGNGLTDLQEFEYGLDPNVWSSANDGIPDGWAIQYGFDPTFAGTASLVAANGNTVWQCYEADLNPTNAASQLAFIGMSSGNNAVQLGWIGGVNATQYLLASPALTSTQWNVVFTNTPPTGITNHLVLPIGITNLFYRIEATR